MLTFYHQYFLLFLPQMCFFLIPFVKMLPVQKQPPEMFCKKRCCSKFYKFHRKTPVLGSLFNNFIKKRFLHSCFPLKFAKCFRNSIT